MGCARRDLDGLVNPQRAHREERCARKDERQARPLPNRHVRFLQQALERAPWTAASWAQTLASLSMADSYGCRQRVEIDRPMRIALQLERPSGIGQLKD
jgi:hypothetical protein